MPKKLSIGETWLYWLHAMTVHVHKLGLVTHLQVTTNSQPKQLLVGINIPLNMKTLDQALQNFTHPTAGSISYLFSEETDRSKGRMLSLFFPAGFTIDSFELPDIVYMDQFMKENQTKLRDISAKRILLTDAIERERIPLYSEHYLATLEVWHSNKGIPKVA